MTQYILASEQLQELQNLLMGDVTEFFDVGVIQSVRCPRGIGPNAPGLEEAMRGEKMGQ